VINHHERAHAIRDARLYLERLENDDGILSRVRRRPIKPANAPDGYPRGGDGIGGQTGHSDPTAGAVESWVDTERTRVADLVDEAWSKLIDAFGLLKAADSCRARALEPQRPRMPEGTSPPAAVWCISCARPWPGTKQSITFEPRSSMTKRGRDDLCSWCLRQWEASNEDPTSRVIPDVRLVVWHHEHPGRYLTATIEKAVLAESLESVRARAPRDFGRSDVTSVDA
jgi:hypothetical protein